MGLEIKIPKKKYVCIGDDDDPLLIVYKSTKFIIGELYHIECSPSGTHGYIYDKVDNYLAVVLIAYVKKNFIVTKGSGKVEAPYCSLVNSPIKREKFICIKNCKNKVTMNMSKEPICFIEGRTYVIQTSYNQPGLRYIYEDSEQSKYLCCVESSFLEEHFLSRNEDNIALIEVDSLFEKHFFDYV